MQVRRAVRSCAPPPCGASTTSSRGRTPQSAASSARPPSPRSELRGTRLETLHGRRSFLPDMKEKEQLRGGA
eukprot:10697464-Alexandrium_andersonii.AAC.1